MSADILAMTVRRDAPERYLASLFAPADVRERLWALHAYDLELAQIPAKVTEPVIGEMRLAWARDAIADLFADPPRVRRHPVYEAMASVLTAPGAPELDDLLLLTDARQADLGEGAFPDAPERERYVERTSVQIVRMAARLCAPDWQGDEAAQAGLAAAGQLWGYAHLLRHFARLCAAGRPPVTEEELDKAGIGLEALRRGLQPQAALKVREGLLEAARAAASDLDRTRSSLPAEIFPALGHAVLARTMVQQTARQTDPYAMPGEASPLLNQLRLLAASLTGRV